MTGTMLYKLLTPQRYMDLLSKETARRIIPVDSTWYLPNLGKNGRQEFLNVERIPNAVYFDIDDIKNNDSPYPHMAPTLETFNSKMSQLGLRQDDILVVYDRIGNFSSPRCAWTLSLFGHENIYLLNNFNVYKALNLPLDTKRQATLTNLSPSTYKSMIDLRSKEIVSYEEMLSLVESDELKSKYNVFDARPLGRFKGVDPEPRTEIKSGHIPGAQPLPFFEILDSTDKTFPQDVDSMKKKLNEALAKLGDDMDANKPIIAMCGTGVTGTIIKTAFEHAGFNNVKLYDGSWTEWALKCQDVKSHLIE
ncbi:hypothetical protein KAFR_0A03940 [Kazachstania africana CBS 2517]|uniref:Sulfurtransferase n=1 Tax=Kazachstania africana (strain ATCC 22294 / BCRC 22015 / CBS 2517 / CECT 1963 / NBRC 1671 / NRRL Y-8276) TaxID=1071382 RepID=H2AN79_KAZAF|nr:hypothetical protein KAFR_0A03940 [Kazachstania africana CBS 2517]CCF55829.1 hypothetical protein KAFR_0A03940 [Kazachstania africana CBS 2517]